MRDGCVINEQDRLVIDKAWLPPFYKDEQTDSDSVVVYCNNWTEVLRRGIENGRKSGSRLKETKTNVRLRGRTLTFSLSQLKVLEEQGGQAKDTSGISKPRLE